MRSYIFTPRERTIVTRFLNGDIGANNGDIKQIKSRIRHFVNLPGDIELYLRLREMMTK